MTLQIGFPVSARMLIKPYKQLKKSDILYNTLLNEKNNFKANYKVQEKSYFPALTAFQKFNRKIVKDSLVKPMSSSKADEISAKCQYGDVCETEPPLIITHKMTVGLVKIAQQLKVGDDIFVCCEKEGISKQSTYKNPEYYCYHPMSYYNIHVHLSRRRLPQPFNRPNGATQKPNKFESCEDSFEPKDLN